MERRRKLPPQESEPPKKVSALPPKFAIGLPKDPLMTAVFRAERVREQSEVLEPDPDNPASIDERIVKKRGGARPGAGRKKGSRTRLEAKLEREIQKVIDDNGDGKKLDALVLYQRVYSNLKVPTAVRMKAAALALPYEKEKLAATKVMGADGGPVEYRITAAKESLKRKLLKEPGPVADRELDRRLN